MDAIDYTLPARINGRKLRVVSYTGQFVSVYTSVKGHWRSIVCFKSLENLPRRGYARMAVALTLFPGAAG